MKFRYLVLIGILIITTVVIVDYLISHKTIESRLLSCEEQYKPCLDASGYMVKITCENGAVNCKEGLHCEFPNGSKKYCIDGLRVEVGK